MDNIRQTPVESLDEQFQRVKTLYEQARMLRDRAIAAEGPEQKSLLLACSRIFLMDARKTLQWMAESSIHCEMLDLDHLFRQLGGKA